MRGERVGDPAVQEPAPCDADVLGNEAPELVVGKVVQRRVTRVHLFDKASARQLLHRCDCLVLATTTGLMNGIEPEPAPDHGGGVQKLPSCFAQGGDAREQKVAHSHRHLPIEPLLLGAGEGGGKIFDEEEGKTLRLPVQPFLESLGKLTGIAGDRMGELDCRWEVQPADLDDGGQVGALSVGQQNLQAPRSDDVRAEGEQHENGARPESPDEV